MEESSQNGPSNQQQKPLHSSFISVSNASPLTDSFLIQRRSTSGSTGTSSSSNRQHSSHSHSGHGYGHSSSGGGTGGEESEGLTLPSDIIETARVYSDDQRSLLGETTLLEPSSATTTNSDMVQMEEDHPLISSSTSTVSLSTTAILTDSIHNNKSNTNNTSEAAADSSKTKSWIKPFLSLKKRRKDQFEDDRKSLPSSVSSFRLTPANIQQQEEEEQEHLRRLHHTNSEIHRDAYDVYYLSTNSPTNDQFQQQKEQKPRLSRHLIGFPSIENLLYKNRSSNDGGTRGDLEDGEGRARGEEKEEEDGRGRKTGKVFDFFHSDLLPPQTSSSAFSVFQPSDGNQANHPTSDHHPTSTIAKLSSRPKDRTQEIMDLMAQNTETPRVTIEETQKYTFAVVLKHTDQIYDLLRQRFPSKSSSSIRRDLNFQVSKLQQKCIKRLIQAGLGVILLDNDAALYDQFYANDTLKKRDEEIELVTKNICILIDPKKDFNLLLHEFKREMDELAIQNGEDIGRLGEEAMDSLKDLCFSPALEMQLTHNIIQNALKDYDKEEWVIDVNKELTVKDIVQEVFPLHDRVFNKRFFDEYRSQTLTFNVRKTTSGNSDRWAVEELRLHFGERVAFLFAFMHIYTKHLLPITVLCVIYYMVFRFMKGFVWQQYVQGLAVIGFGVACLWAPSFLLCWERETRLLIEKWNLSRYQKTVYEKNDSNPEFQYVWMKNEITKEMEKIPKQRNIYLIQVMMLFYVLLSALIQCLCLLPFIQWYVFAKNAPTCTYCHATQEQNTKYKCVWFITCFVAEDSSLGTDRWSYILVQGILLGLLIDIIFFEIFNWISEKFVKWENLAKKSDYENRLIHRRFVFVWSNWFFWFLFLAFVYLPFGQVFLEYFRQIPYLGYLAPYSWDPTLLTLDTLFVTPLVVTQFLNMLLETVVPYLVRRFRGQPVTCRKMSPLIWCTRRLTRRFFHASAAAKNNDGQQDATSSSGTDTTAATTTTTTTTTAEEELEQQERRIKYLSAKKLSELVLKKNGINVDVLECTDDSNQYSAYEIIAESKLPIFDPMFDYLDASIQFSYVVMFTVVWPLLPFPAFVNNLFEVRGDAFRLLFAHRRPMPRRDTSIGEWAIVLAYANIIGVTVVMAFLACYHMGFFYTNCNFTFSEGNMVPFSAIDPKKAHFPEECRDDITNQKYYNLIQVSLFVVLEHFGFCVRYLVLQFEKTPSVIRSSAYQRVKQIQHLTEARAGTTNQFEYIKTLRQVFDQYDVVHKDGHLREHELILFLAEWIRKHPSELMPYSGIIFRYMDKNALGKISFASLCLMLQHVHHDRFLSCMLGLYDPLQDAQVNEQIHRASDAMELRKLMESIGSRPSLGGSMTPRDSLHQDQQDQFDHAMSASLQDTNHGHKEIVEGHAGRESNMSASSYHSATNLRQRDSTFFYLAS